MKKLIVLLSFSLVVDLAVAQNLQRPKLVVGIVVDQMRWDYLYRFSNRYGTGGFKRLLREGFSCEQTFIPYTPTHTAPGHTSVYTGSVPALHGIMGNNWYVPREKKIVYCADDFSVQTVGSTSTAGRMSPRNLWSTTITDELRLATNFKNKTIAIAIKDRGAILPGGHTANAAYWFDNASGGWISSSFYMTDLPDWVKKFNERRLPDQYMSKDWNTLYPISTYDQSAADSNAYEGRMMGEDYTFPHKTSTITANKYEAFRGTPGGNSFTLDMARAAVEAEQLGKSKETDFLAVSLSSTDYIGHTYGPNSIEVEDAYLRLDKDLAAFLIYLDSKIGKGQYLCFLTADHGAAHNPSFLRDAKIPAGSDGSAYRGALTDSLDKYFHSKSLIEQTINYQYFLNDSIIAAWQINRDSVKAMIISQLMKNPGIAMVVDLEHLQESNLPDKVKTMIANGYNPLFSGDLQVIYKPQWFDNQRTGTSHGLWNPYDSHIPLVFFGWHVKPGKTNRETYMTDIAPTLATMLHIQMPNACIGHPVTEITDRLAD